MEWKTTKVPITENIEQVFRGSLLGVAWLSLCHLKAGAPEIHQFIWNRLNFPLFYFYHFLFYFAIKLEIFLFLPASSDGFNQFYSVLSLESLQVRLYVIYHLSTWLTGWHLPINLDSSVKSQRHTFLDMSY